MTITTQGPGHKGDGSFHQCGSPDVVAVGQAENRLLSRDFVFATLADFANAFGMQMLVTTLPVYVISLGGSSADAGLVSGALALTALIFRPFVDWLTDAWRRLEGDFHTSPPCLWRHHSNCVIQGR